MDILRRIRFWRRWQIGARVDSVGSAPDSIPARRAVIVGAPACNKWLIFDCPCRRGHRVMLNLDPRNHPRWRVSNYLPLTLYPSVNERSDVGRCHYVLRDGQVRWLERTDYR